MSVTKNAILSCSLMLLASGCLVTKSDTKTDQLADLDNCSMAYRQSFSAAVEANAVEFCLGNKPNPEFIQDGLGGYCFMPRSEDPADFSILHESSFITDCVDMFAQVTKQPTHCEILKTGNHPSSGVGATAYNTCIINYARVTGDVTACDQLEQTEDDGFGLPDDQEC